MDRPARVRIELMNKHPMVAHRRTRYLENFKLIEQGYKVRINSSGWEVINSKNVVVSEGSWTKYEEQPSLLEDVHLLPSINSNLACAWD